jgi:hypothetical protein
MRYAPSSIEHLRILSQRAKYQLHKSLYRYPANKKYTFTLQEPGSGCRYNFDFARRCNLCQTVPPRVLDIYPALANCECTHSAAATLCVMAFHQPATVAHPTPKCHHESGSLASLALVIIIVANATARVESVFHSSNFQFALELTECTPDVWTCAHSRTWMSFAFCYKKDIDTHYACIYVSAFLLYGMVFAPIST